MMVDSVGFAVPWTWFMDALLAGGMSLAGNALVGHAKYRLEDWSPGHLGRYVFDRLEVHMGWFSDPYAATMAHGG